MDTVPDAISLRNLRVKVPVSVTHRPPSVEIEPRRIVTNGHHADTVPAHQ